MHRLSVIIPTYNRSATIATAVESVLSQSHPPGEVVVVDDGSTDSTRLILRPFHRHIRLLRIPHSGVSVARNHGIARSSGSWLAFLDSDDTWHPEKLRFQFEALSTTGHSLCFCASATQDRTPLDDLKQPPNAQDSFIECRPARDGRYLSQPRHPFLQSLLVRRDLLVQAGAFAPWLEVAEDTRLIQRLVWNSPSTIVHRQLCCIRRHPNHDGLSSEPRLPFARSHYICYASVQAELLPLALAAGPEASRVIHNQFYHFLSRLAEIELADGKYDSAKRFAKAALAGPPSLRRFLRCATILSSPSLASAVFSHKWKPILPYNPSPPSPLARSASSSSALPADSAPSSIECSPAITTSAHSLTQTSISDPAAPFHVLSMDAASTELS